MARRLCAVSVDVDEIGNYFDIHGIPRSEDGAHAAYDVGLPRLGAFAEQRGLPVTLFAVGEDLAREPSARVLRALSDRGHAVENHSFGHRYDLTRLDADTIAREIDEGSRAIERVTGRRPTGFRAPGYTVNDRVFDALELLGVAFDSSVFPCPPYYLAKAAAMAAIALRGRASRSVLDTPRVLGAPTTPYRPGPQWWRPSRVGERSRSFVELPIQVTPGPRLPFIGTTLGLAGPTLAARLAKSCVGAPLVNLELHAIDFIDAGEGLDALRPHQPELRVPIARRLDALTAALDVFAAAGYAFVRLDEAAEAFR